MQMRVLSDLVIESLSVGESRVLHNGDFHLMQIWNTAKTVGLFTTR